MDIVFNILSNFCTSIAASYYPAAFITRTLLSNSYLTLIYLCTCAFFILLAIILQKACLRR